MDKNQYEVRFSLRLPADVHLEIKKLAAKEGVSINQYMVYALAKHIWDPDNTGQIQLAPPIAEQRRQNREFRRSLGEPLSDEALHRIIAEREQLDRENDQQEK